MGAFPQRIPSQAATTPPGLTLGFGTDSPRLSQMLGAHHWLHRRVPRAGFKAGSRSGTSRISLFKPLSISPFPLCAYAWLWQNPLVRRVLAVLVYTDY